MTSDEATERIDPRDQPGRVARNIASVAGSQVLTWAFSAISIVIVPRALGPEAIGQLGFAVALWALAAILVAFGAGPLIIREMSQDPARGSRLLSTAIPMHVMAWVAVSIPIAGYAVLADVDSTTRSLLVIIGCITLLANITQSLRSSIIGRERLVFSSAISVIDRVIAALVTVSAVLLGFGVEVVAAVGAVGTTVSALAFVVALLRDPEVSLRISLGAVREVLTGALPLMFLGGALLLYREIDILALSALADNEDVGYYAATDRLFGAMIVIPASITMALFPTLARRWATDEQGVRATLRRLTGLLTVFTLPVGIGAAIVGEDLGVAILGGDFRESGEVVQVYGLVLIPVGWTVLHGTFCRIAKRERVWTRVLLVAAAATIPLDIVLVPWADDQFENAALAGAIAFLITESGAAIFGFRRLLPGTFDRELRSSLLRASIAVALMAGVLLLADDLHVFIRVVIGAAVYAIGVLGFGAVRPGELASLGGPFARFARFQSRETDDSPVGDDAQTPSSES